MIPLPDHTPDQSSQSIRMDARLDQTTRANVDDLAKRFHRPRAAVLSQIMQWGLRRAQTGSFDQGDAQGPVRHLSLYVDSELHERVQNAATAAGVKTPSWLRHMVRQSTPGRIARSSALLVGSTPSWHAQASIFPEQISRYTPPTIDTPRNPAMLE